MQEIIGNHNWLITGVLEGSPHGCRMDVGWCYYLWDRTGLVQKRGGAINAPVLPLTGLKVSERRVWAEEPKVVDVFVSKLWLRTHCVRLFGVRATGGASAYSLSAELQNHPALRGFPDDGFPELKFYNLIEGASQVRLKGLEGRASIINGIETSRSGSGGQLSNSFPTWQLRL